MATPRILAIGTPPTFRQDVANALDMGPDAVDWLPSVTAAEEFLVVRHMSPHVIALSPDIKEPDALGIADFAANSTPTTAVVLIRNGPANGLLPAAMRAGIRDVVDLTRGEDEMVEALKRAIKWSEHLKAGLVEGATGPEQRGRIISVFSSKGGVGKTFLASNVSAALSERSTEEDTALVDFDLKVGDTFSYFGKEPSRRLDDLVALGDKGDRDSIVASGMQLRPHLWAYGALPDPAAESMPGETTGKVLRALRACFDHVVVDASNDYSDQTVAVFDLSDEIWLVTGLDVVGMRHLLIAMDTLDSLGIPGDRIRVVLNRADSKVGVSLADVERVLKVRIDAKIPSSELVPRSLNHGVPLVVAEPRSEVAAAVMSLADDVAGRESQIADAAPAGRRKLRLLLGIG
jgi:pilus assembly protein CpaE